MLQVGETGIDKEEKIIQYTSRRLLQIEHKEVKLIPQRETSEKVYCRHLVRYLVTHPLVLCSGFNDERRFNSGL
jgi:hypothetical protein